MKLPYFTHEYCSNLLSQIEDNLTYYQKGEPIDVEKNVQESAIELGSPPVLSGTTSKDDAENAIRLHQWLKITPEMAADKRVWTCLAHTVFYKFCTARYDYNNAAIAKNRMFMTGIGFTSRVRNVLGRLWWAAHLTYEKDKDDCYRKTRSFLANQDIHTALSQRAIGYIRPLLSSALDALEKKDADISKNKGDIAKAFAKSLNIYGGTRLFEAIPQDELQSLVEMRLNDAIRRFS